MLYKPTAWLERSVKLPVQTKDFVRPDMFHGTNGINLFVCSDAKFGCGEIIEDNVEAEV